MGDCVTLHDALPVLSRENRPCGGLGKPSHILTVKEGRVSVDSERLCGECIDVAIRQARLGIEPYSIIVKEIRS